MITPIHIRFRRASLLVPPGAAHGFAASDLRQALDARVQFIQSTAL